MLRIRPDGKCVQPIGSLVIQQRDETTFLHMPTHKPVWDIRNPHTCNRRIDYGVHIVEFKSTTQGTLSQLSVGIINLPREQLVVALVGKCIM